MTAADAAMNEFLLACFSTAAGQRVLAGLTNRYGSVLPPTATDGEMRYREGQRSVLADIMKGIADGRDSRKRTATAGDPGAVLGTRHT